MAAIYDLDGETITDGLQGCFICSEAEQVAIKIAEYDDAPVILVDDDGDWMVHPTGEIEAFEWDDPVVDDDPTPAKPYRERVWSL